MSHVKTAVDRIAAYQATGDVSIRSSSCTEATKLHWTTAAAAQWTCTRSPSAGSASILIDTSHLHADGKNLLVFYDGPDDPRACGESVLGSIGQSRIFAVVYIGDPCWGTSNASSPDAVPGTPDFTPLHELFHGFGALHTPPPGSQPVSNDEYARTVCDLMYIPKLNTCPTGWFLDPYLRNYYSPEGFADGRPNAYDSLFLTPPQSSR